MRFFSKTAALCTLCLVGALAGCAAPPPPPAPAPRPAPPRPAPPPPRPVPQATDWRDIPLTPGDWRYEQDAGGSEAVFAPGNPAAFVLRCERAARRILLTRPVGGGAQLRITTSYGARLLPGRAEGNGVSVPLPASDALLDGIAFSRGRFTVENESGAMLVMPSWPEPARVIEDCRDPN